jgi:hypothetical protein
MYIYNSPLYIFPQKIFPVDDYLGIRPSNVHRNAHSALIVFLFLTNI